MSHTLHICGLLDCVVTFMAGKDISVSLVTQKSEKNISDFQLLVTPTCKIPVGELLS